MSIKKRIHDLFLALFYFERRIDPYYRDTFDKIFREPISALVQALINLRRKDDHLQIGEEKLLPNEKEITDSIIEQMSMFTRKHYVHSFALRVGNTKTYGVIRGEFEVLPDLADNLRQGIFSHPKTYPAWVRFAGPGPLAPPDMKDAGISSPTFTTPNTIENLKLQKQVLAGTPLFYFINPFDSHFLDAIMQGLYAKTQTSPLEVQYFSCVPYLFGDGQAIQYSVRPRSNEKTKIPKKPSANYLREAMVNTLNTKEVLFDFMIQFQTDTFRMPIENASGHCIADHRPLGNQNRARKAVYYKLSELRQTMNGEVRIEPTGAEVFDD